MTMMPLGDRELADILTRDSLAGSSSSTSNAQPRPINQRFLLNTLRNVDDHNRGNRTVPNASTSSIPLADPSDKDYRTSDSRSFADFTKKKRKRDDSTHKSKKGKSKQPNPFESKMDKYFEADYDPATDINLPDNATDQDFDSWNIMLDNVRERNKLKQQRETELWEEEKKKERERENIKLGREKAKIAKLLGPDAEKEYQKRKKDAKRARKEETKEMIKSQVISSVDSESTLMSMQYNKKGTTREWDVGKK